jgi:hypothetical protein
MEYHLKIYMPTYLDIADDNKLCAYNPRPYWDSHRKIFYVTLTQIVTIVSHSPVVLHGSKVNRTRTIIMNYFCSLIPTSRGCASVFPHLTFQYKMFVWGGINVTV